MITTEQNKQRTCCILIFFALLACALISPLASNHFFPNLADYINHLSAIINAKHGLDEGQFPLRIAPIALNGYRYPYFQFYSPTTFMLAGAIYKWVTPEDPLLAFRIMLWLGLMLGGFYMYKLSNWLVKSWQIAVLAGVVFLASPYYLIVINHLGNLTESFALGLMPVAVYYTLRRFYHPTNNWYFLKGALVWYLIITVHIPTAIYTTIFVYLWLFMMMCMNRKLIQPFIATLIMYGLACLLAMWYLIPIHLFSPLMLVASTYTSANHFVLFSPLLSQLLSPASAPTLSSKSAMITIHPAIGWPILLAAGLCFYAMINGIKVMDERTDNSMRALAIVFFIVFIMVWSPINFWNYLPSIFLAGQYSWRLLGQIIWIGAILFAWSLVWFAKNRIDNTVLCILVGVMVTMSSSWFSGHENFIQVIETFVKKPVFVYNDNSYALNFNDHPYLANAIDSMLLYSLMDGDKLNLNKRYVFPPQLLELTSKPVVEVNADVSNDLAKRNITLSALVNGKKVADYPLRAGHMHWSFPLAVSLPNNTTMHFIAISSQEKNILDIPIKTVTLTGFLASDKALTVRQVKPYCHVQEGDVLCQLNVPTNINLIELPVIYYPHLMNITINGKPVAYQSVVVKNNLLTTIVPVANKINNIAVHFTGVVWANWVSEAAWGLWLMWLCICVWHAKKSAESKSCAEDQLQGAG